MKICPKCHSSYQTLVCQHCAMRTLYDNLCQREQPPLAQAALGRVLLHTVMAPGIRHLRMFLEARMTFCSQTVGAGWRSATIKFSELGQRKICHACLTQVEKLLADAKETA